MKSSLENPSIANTEEVKEEVKEEVFLKNIRVFYQKLSRAKYISHLDITRCMQRAIKRSGVPVWYTQGFNPHIYLTFALPLSLGYESESESMDIRLVKDMPFDEVKTRLNSALPPDIRVISVDEQHNKPSTITKSLFTVTLSGENADALKSAFLEFMQREKIEVLKHSKKGEITIDIKPYCEIVSITTQDNAIKIALKTASGNEKSVNPTLLTDEFLRQNCLDNIVTSVMRNAVFMANGELFS